MRILIGFLAAGLCAQTVVINPPGGGGGGGAVASVYGRTGAVAAATGDYTEVQIPEASASVNFAASPYTVPASVSYLACDASGGAVVLNLPAASGSNRKLTLKKIDATANACTLTRAGADVIDGATTVALTLQNAAAKILDRATGTWDRTHIVAESNVLNLVSDLAAKLPGTLTSGVIAPSGACASASQYVNTAATPNQLWSCINLAWQLIQSSNGTGQGSTTYTNANGTTTTILTTSATSNITVTLPATTGTLAYGSAVAFSGITSGSNTTAAMTVGSGATLTVDGAGGITYPIFFVKGGTTGNSVYPGIQMVKSDGTVEGAWQSDTTNGNLYFDNNAGTTRFRNAIGGGTVMLSLSSSNVILNSGSTLNLGTYLADSSNTGPYVTMTSTLFSIVGRTNLAFTAANDGSLKFPHIPSTTGTRYLCVATDGTVSSSASACSGT